MPTVQQSRWCGRRPVQIQRSYVGVLRHLGGSVQHNCTTVRKFSETCEQLPQIPGQQAAPARKAPPADRVGCVLVASRASVRQDDSRRERMARKLQSKSSMLWAVFRTRVGPGSKFCFVAPYAFAFCFDNEIANQLIIVDSDRVEQRTHIAKRNGPAI